MTPIDMFIAGAAAVFFGNMLAWGAQEVWYSAEDANDDDSQ